jgi:hypothetical protein
MQFVDCMDMTEISVAVTLAAADPFDLH